MKTLDELNYKHSTFERETVEWFISHGFLVDSATYHDKMKKEMVGLLQSRYSPTALCIRTRADRIAVHTTKPIELQFECKTHISTKYSDLTIELVPLAHHIISARLGVKCLYVCLDYSGRHRGFWAGDLPEIREARIPKSRLANPFFYDILNLLFRHLPALGTYSNAGSGDPFVVIDRAVVDKLPSWQSLVESLISA